MNVLHNGNGTISHYRTRAVVCTYGRDCYGILPFQIKLCRGAKGNRSLESVVQLCPSVLKRRNLYQEIPPSMLDRPILPSQWGNPEMFERPPLLCPFPTFKHISFIEYFMAEEHVFRISRTYNGVTEGFRRQSVDMIRVGVGQEVQFRRDGVVRR